MKKPFSKVINQKKEYSFNKRQALRLFFILFGHASLLLGFIGIFIPILPTTPFVLVATWSYAKSSPQFHKWIYNSELFGPFIQRWEKDRTISLKSKLIALTMLTFSISASVIWLISIFEIKILVAIIGILVFAYILRIPQSRDRDSIDS